MVNSWEYGVRGRKKSKIVPRCQTQVDGDDIDPDRKCWGGRWWIQF